MSVSAQDFNGVWELVLDKSNIPPITKSQLLTIETDGVNVTMREELVNEKNETLIITLTGKFDGHDNPVGGTPFADTVSYQLHDQNVIEGVAKKNGRICVRERAVLSNDGCSVSVTYCSYDDNGNTFEHFGYFERVDKADKPNDQ